MENKIIGVTSSLAKLLFFHESMVLDGVEILSEAIDIANSSRKEKMINLAISEMQLRIKDIAVELYKQGDNFYEYLDKFILPIALHYAQKEEQEAKIKYIVSGVKNIIDKRLLEENIILTYYDILNDLRISEIKHLVNYYYKGINIISDQEADNKKDETEIKLNGYFKYVDNKLEGLGLIKTVVFDGGTFDDENNEKIPFENSPLTEFGKDFIEFFKLNLKF